MKKWKAFDEASWSALLSSLARIKKTADDNSSAVFGLGEDLAKLSENTARTLQALDKAVGETQDALDKLRQDLADGTAAVKPVFPVVSADPASPREGEAWVLGGQPNAGR